MTNTGNGCVITGFGGPVGGRTLRIGFREGHFIGEDVGAMAVSDQALNLRLRGMRARRRCRRGPGEGCTWAILARTIVFGR